jgi:hypothetical protein
MDNPPLAVWLLEVIGCNTLDTAVPVAPFLWRLHATSMASKVDEDGIVFLDCRVGYQILKRAFDGMPCCLLIAQALNSVWLNTSVYEKPFYTICVGNSSLQISSSCIRVFIDTDCKSKQTVGQAEEGCSVEERAMEDR